VGAFSISRHKKKRPLHCKSLLGSVLAGKTLNSQFSEHKKGFIGEAFFVQWIDESNRYDSPNDYNTLIIS